MRIAAHRGSRLHAPENSRSALISGYTAGADVIEFDLQLTKDGQLVLSHDPTTDRLTGKPGKILDLTIAELKAFDFSETFQPRNSPTFKYFPPKSRKLSIETFPAILEYFPENVDLLIELKHDSSLNTGRRDEFIRKIVNAVLAYDLKRRTVFYSKDPENLKLFRSLIPDVRIAAFDFELDLDRQIELMESLQADGLVTDLDSIFQEGKLTAAGAKLADACTGKRIGAVLYPYRKPGLFTREEWLALKDIPWIWSLSTDSMLDCAFTRHAIPLVTNEPFNGDINRQLFALGYAKANEFAKVTHDGGVIIDIKDYPPFPLTATDPMEARLEVIETKLMYTAKDWPYYSGGGVGYIPGIRGDFCAEVDYVVQTTSQASTLEMAVLNVDPGAHQGKVPTSFRGKDSFYDPHGAPPYVGVEHDEDDGLRINWNLGSEYDSNQYGHPVGDGKNPHSGRLRLERRGEYFSAYYKNEFDAKDWVCCGVTRNHSLNQVVYLRCVGKRWRQEDEANPSQFLPVIPNKFEFRNLTIIRFIE